MLGVFGRGGSADFKKLIGRSVTDRRVGIPLGSQYAEASFAEYIVEAAKPFNVYATGQTWVGPTVYEYAHCRQVASLIPQAGHDYELVFEYSAGGGTCGFRLFEIVSRDAGSFVRQEETFDPALRYTCPAGDY
jgi:hypothetical protein